MHVEMMFINHVMARIMSRGIDTLKFSKLSKIVARSL